MRVALLQAEEGSSLLSLALGGEATAAETAIELLRHEVTARGGAARRFVIDRVCRLAAPAVALEAEAVEALCDELERAGDVVQADGGVLYPTPVRIVGVGEGVFRFVSAMPTARLTAAVPGEWSRRGVRRDCRPAAAIEAVAAALGGVVMSAETWAGFDRVPAANEAWIGGLERRLRWAPQAAGSLEREEELAWTGLDLSKGPRWQADASSKLWRARHRWRGWLYAWTTGTSPSAGSFVSLHSDEGTRTAHALARSSPLPFTARLAWGPETATLTIPVWLPHAEYRFLSTSGEALAAERGRGSRWVVPAPRTRQVVETLKARLGLAFEETSAE